MTRAAFLLAVKFELHLLVFMAISLSTQPAVNLHL